MWIEKLTVMRPNVDAGTDFGPNVDAIAPAVAYLSRIA